MSDSAPDEFPAVELVVPFLRTFPSVNVWHMGCPAPEEPYWTALVLRSALRDRFRIYVTDHDQEALVDASDFGEHGAFAAVRSRMTFFQWDGTTDGSFNEFQLVVARSAPTERAFMMIHASLCRLGMLDVGRGARLNDNPFASCYEALDSSARLYRRIR